MRGLRRRAFLLSLWSAALLVGCNFPSNLYFLMPESKEPAECKRLASEDSKKEVKAVLWTYMSSLDPREEFIQADRHLAGMLAEEIRKMSDENHEKVTIVKPNMVEQYKSRHANWQSFRRKSAMTSMPITSSTSKSRSSVCMSRIPRICITATP
jgi:hypothetical protein